MNKISKVKGKDNVFKVELTLTKGELLALENGMREYALKSPVGADVFLYLCNAMKKDGLC